MADKAQTLDDVEEADVRKMTRQEAEDYAKRQQYGQSGDALDTTLGHMGGAGAAASGPDIGKQSEGRPWNSGDLPKRP
jgi:hypothetical protein